MPKRQKTTAMARKRAKTGRQALDMAEGRAIANQEVQSAWDISGLGERLESTVQGRTLRTSGAGLQGVTARTQAAELSPLLCTAGPLHLIASCID